MKQLLAVLLIFYSLSIHAQAFGCIDSLAISPGFPCPDPTYYPVCGCDNKTYRNVCDATLRNGVLTYVDGSCTGFEFDIIPTIDPFSITFTLVQATPRTAQLFIVDINGRTWIQRPLFAVDRQFYTIEISTLNYGPYILYIYDSNGSYRWKKFVKSSG